MRKFKELSKGKKITILVAIIAIILGVSLFTKWEMDEKQKQKEISEQLIAIEQWNGKINDEKDDSKKLEALKSLIDEYTEYQNGDNYAEVNSKYETLINDVKNDFVKKYDESLKKNTLKDVDKIDNKSTLNDANKSLNDLLKIVNGEEGKITLSESQIKDYGTKVNGLINKYDKRVKAIEKKEKEQKEKEEAERKAKEEAEAKAAEEQQKQQQQNAVANNNANSNNNSYQQPSNNGEGNSNSSNSSSNSNSGGNSNNNSSNNSNSNQNNGGTWHDGMAYKKWTFADGSIFEAYTDNQGNAYDMNGNYIGNIYDDLFG